MIGPIGLIGLDFALVSANGEHLVVRCLLSPPQLRRIREQMTTVPPPPPSLGRIPQEPRKAKRVHLLCLFFSLLFPAHNAILVIIPAARALVGSHGGERDDEHSNATRLHPRLS